MDLIMKIKPNFISIPPEDPFKFDSIDLKDSIQNISTLLQKISSPITFSINAPWGTGKTTFINMLKADLQLAQCSTVLFSAWHTDFAGDPLLAFLGEIDSQLHKGSVEHNLAWSLTKSAGEILIKKGIPAALKIMTMGVLDTKDFVEETMGELAKDASSSTIEKYESEKDQIITFKNSLSKTIQEAHNGKLFIFIDELDRCRPTYAVELLERIKHLFDIEGLTFIIAMDKEQLSHSVRSIYGESFESIGYLKRFIDIEYQLPKPNLKKFINGLYHNLELEEYFQARGKHSGERTDWVNLSDTIYFLSEIKKLSLRDIEQLFTKITLVLNLTPPNYHLYPALTAFLVVAHEYHYHEYKNALESKKYPSGMIEILYEIVPKDERLDKYKGECAFIEANLMNSYFNMESLSSENSNEIENRHTSNISSGNVQEKNYSNRVMQISNRFHDTIDVSYITKKIELLSRFTF